MKQLLKNDSRFGDYEVATLMSQHHCGEREVYRATRCETGEYVALTVFNLGCKRYESDGMARKRVPDFIEEVAFLRSRGESSNGFAKVVDCGITKVGKKKLGWIAQQYYCCASLSEILYAENVVSLPNVLKIMKVLNGAITEIMQYTRGGGHYGISIDNVLVEIDKEGNIQDVKLIGLTNIGTRYHGAVPFGNDECDNRFRAPETVNGVFTHLTDIYALGMVMVSMLCGVAEYEYSIEGFDKIDPLKYRNAFMDKSRKFLSASLRLILDRATDVNAQGRFQTADKFQYFLNKLSTGQVSTQSHIEPSATNSTRSEKLEGESDEEWFARLDREAIQKAHANTRHGGKCLVDDRRKRLKGGENLCGGLDEVAGMAELKDLFRRNFVRIVRNPEIAEAYGITPCNCTLLYGPQGCGKTFIAEKAAQESGLKYKIVNPSDLGSIYIHGSQEKIAETFREAEKNAPMILIFDEFDAIAHKRDGDLTPHQANEVNELLTRLNNCAEKGVYVLATTNRPQLIDSAVLRSGRTDLMFYVSLPDYIARREIFELELKKRPCSEDIDLAALAKATENFTCSDLSFVVKECARRCFDETIAAGVSQPIPLSQSKILDVIKSTHSSVSEEEIKSYKELKDKMEHRNENNNRRRVGFSTNS